jgi:hypothetical protein
VPGGTYHLGSTTLDITHTLRIRGESTAAGGGATVLKWNSGTTGIRVQSFNTTGATAVIAPAPSDNTSGQGSIIEGLLLQGNYAGTESEAHGIHLRGDATVRDCGIYGFAGDGIHVNATAGSGAPNEGNDNNSRFENLLTKIAATASSSTVPTPTPAPPSVSMPSTIAGSGCGTHRSSATPMWDIRRRGTAPCRARIRHAGSAKAATAMW